MLVCSECWGKGLEGAQAASNLSQRAAISGLSPGGSSGPGGGWPSQGRPLRSLGEQLELGGGTGALPRLGRYGWCPLQGEESSSVCLGWTHCCSSCPLGVTGRLGWGGEPRALVRTGDGGLVPCAHLPQHPGMEAGLSGLSWSNSLFWKRGASAL